jgi:demethylmenaquinone methyltransferase/2-methoxy-6-polyprenyl-1,4-benzoquinol methylase
VWLTDINESMLRVGRDRLLDAGVMTPNCLCDAEHIPFPDAYFDVVTVAFGLRNMTHKDRALAEMRRVVKPGGKVMVLEFSKVWQPLEKAYDVYSFKVLPWLGSKVAGDPESYRYLAESIRMHPDQATLKQAGLGRILQPDGRCRRVARRTPPLILQTADATQCDHLPPSITLNFGVDVLI